MKTINIEDKFLLILDTKNRNKTIFEFIYSKGGSMLEEKEDRGRRHLLEHCILSRSKKLNFQQFKDFAYDNSISYNAYTSPTLLALEAQAHKSDFQLVFDLYFEIFTDPTFEDVILAKEKEIVIKEIADRKGTPEYQLYNYVNEVLYEDGSISNHEVLGDEDKVYSTSIGDFARIHKQIMNESLLILCVSGGGIDEEYIVQKCKEYLKHNQFHKISDFINQYPNNFRNKDNKTIFHEHAHEQAELNITIGTEVTFENLPIREVFSGMYLRWSGQGLYDHLRDELGLIYGFHFHYDNYGNQLHIYMNCKRELVDTIVEETKKYLESIQYIDDHTRFNKYKEQLIKKQELAADRIGTESEFVFNNYLNYGKSSDFKEFNKSISMLTVEDLKNYKTNLLKAFDKAKIIVVSKQKAI